MSTKRNPFNENVDRLMDKIFSGKGASRAPKKYQEEMQKPMNAGVLHDTHPEKKGGGTGKIKGRPARTKESASPFGMQEHAREEKRGNFLESSLKNISKTTEKIRETTQQLQQMTLKMWAETVQVKEREGKPYREECIPPRNYPGERGNFPEKPFQTEPPAQRQTTSPVSRQTVPSVPRQTTPPVSRHTAPSAPRGIESPVFGAVVPPAYRFPVPQYRMEEALDASVPERIRECKQLARGKNELFSKNELFFRQAKMMEDYEDDCLYPGEFTWYFPTYQAMNVAQLRGYFTWRTQVRQGNLTSAPLSFAFVYVYELLHQIGPETPEEGFSVLQSFWEKYREYDTQLDRYLPNWLSDYVVYYNLDRELLASSQDIAFDRALLGFLHPEGDDEEYFAAICALSSYNIGRSKFYKEYTDDVRKVACAVFRALTAYYEKHGKKTLVEKYFGVLATCSYQMFESAVFYDHKKYVEFEYEINPIHRYRCEKGSWTCQKYFGNRKKNKEMGSILRMVDLRMREEYGYKALTPEAMTKIVMNIIDKEIKRFLAEKEKEEKEKNLKPVIEIDVTKLSGIRRAAEITQNRLIVEEADEAGWGMFFGDLADGEKIGTVQGMAGKEKVETVQDMVGKEKAETVQDMAGSGLKQAGTVPEIDTVLNDTERTFLCRLLNGEPYQEFLRERHQMPSVVADRINEKLFDQFGDTVIVFDGDIPEVLEDYAPEVAAMLGCG